MAQPVWSQGAFQFGPDERAGEWDISFLAIYLDSEDLAGEGGSSLGIRDDWGFGFNIGYNFTNHLALGFEMNFLNPSYDATVIPEDPAETPVTFSHKMDMFNGLLKGTYNLFSGPFTPFVDVSMGFTYVDSRVADGPPSTGCWWHPWYGFICSQFWNTYDDTRFNYGGGLGLRWDINRNMFLRATYSLMRVDVGNTSDPTFDMGRLEFGWRN